MSRDESCDASLPIKPGLLTFAGFLKLEQQKL
jgi:hypothetical protein